MNAITNADEQKQVDAWYRSDEYHVYLDALVRQKDAEARARGELWRGDLSDAERWPRGVPTRPRLRHGVTSRSTGRGRRP